MTVNTPVKEAGFVPASRISAIGVSEILKSGDRAQAMKRDGKPVIILGAGEPDLDTPDQVKKAAWDAIRAGQAAAVAALNGQQDIWRERTASFQRRRDRVVAGLNATAGLDCRVPEGAFYTFSGCSGRPSGWPERWIRIF